MKASNAMPDASRVGSRGGVIVAHRTIATMTLRGVDIVFAILSAALFTAIALVAAPQVFAAWQALFTWGLDALALPGSVGSAPMAVVRVAVPVPLVHADLPGSGALVIGAVLTIALIITGVLVRARALPLAYVCYAVALVVASAVLVFATGATPATTALPAYMAAMMRLSAGVWLFIPVSFGLTLFLLDVGWVWKATLMLAALVLMAVFIPLQQLLTVYVVHHLTQLAVPPLFVFAGTMPQVAMLVGLYSWGASGRPRR